MVSTAGISSGARIHADASQCRTLHCSMRGLLLLYSGVPEKLGLLLPRRQPDQRILQQAPGSPRSAIMAVERTLSIIKPDAVAKNVVGQILARFEAAGLKIVAARMMQLSTADAEAFYAVHRQRPFFKDLVSFMISGPVMVQVLEGENAILKNRELMGATDPKKADKGTIRADFADSIDANAVHGSDAAETAATEIAFFFPSMQIHSR
jgi:nucleoside-diphosphate kinase